jgi:AcrR family transcriptional regulator
MKPRYKTADESYTEILAAGIVVARTKMYNKVTLKEVAALVPCSHGLVLRYFGTSNQLQRAIMGEAIRTNCQEIIAQGIVAKDPRALKLSNTKKKAAFNSQL